MRQSAKWHSILLSGVSFMLRVVLLSVIYSECLSRVSFLLSVIYAECHLCWVSFMLSVFYAECLLCWVSFLLSVFYGECFLCWVSLIQSIIYAKYSKWAHYAECRYAECRYAECRGADSNINFIIWKTDIKRKHFLKHYLPPHDVIRPILLTYYNCKWWS
jgi:hypothetical protein